MTARTLVRTPAVVGVAIRRAARSRAAEAIEYRGRPLDITVDGDVLVATLADSGQSLQLPVAAALDLDARVAFVREQLEPALS